MGGIILSLSLSSQCILTGNITSTEGQALAGATVFIKNINKGGVADRNGLYQIDEVMPGQYTVEVSYIGYRAVEKTITIHPSQRHFTLNCSMLTEPLLLENLVVTATRAHHGAPATYTNIGEQEIQANNLGVDVPFLLQMTPSSIVTSDAGTGIGYTGIRIRGIDATAINVTINGIPLNDAESHGVYWVDLPDFASSTSDIQIQRGIGVTTNGSGAFGAGINLHTNNLRPNPYAEVNLGGGSFNTLKANLLVGSGLLKNGWTFDGRISRITSDGYIDRASADLNSMYFSAAKINSRNSLRVNIFSGREITYQAWNGVPADYINDPVLRTYNSAGTEKPGQPYENEVDNYRQTHYQLFYNQLLGKYWTGNLALHYTRGKGFYEQYKADQSLAAYSSGSEQSDLIRRLWLDNHFYGLVYNFRFQKADSKPTLTIGGGYHNYEGNHFGEVTWVAAPLSLTLPVVYYNNDAKKQEFTTYARCTYPFSNKWQTFLDLQWRAVRYRFLGRDDNGEYLYQSASHVFFNPKWGLRYSIQPNQYLYVFLGVGHREPNRNDYLASTPTSRPKPERLYNAELGYRVTFNKASFSSNLYYMAYRDQLALNGQINQVGEYIRTNLDRSHRAGVEMEAQWTPHPQFSIEANTTISRNYIRQFIEFMDVYDEQFNWVGQKQQSRKNSHIAFSPGISGAIEVSHRAAKIKGLITTLSGKYVGRQFIDNSTDHGNSLDAYFFGDARLEYRRNLSKIKTLGLTFQIRNIFNASYETNAWSYRYLVGQEILLDQGFYPQAGRHFLIGLNIGM